MKGAAKLLVVLVTLFGGFVVGTASWSVVTGLVAGAGYTQASEWLLWGPVFGALLALFAGSRVVDA
jgi:hypothetical protein